MYMQISAKHVKELRNKTGAGMMDCKKALQASSGNIETAIENLRKQGLASANKKMNRIATEGLIESYIHSGSRIGVILEINCETDFVARREEFQTLAKNIAMQIVASPSVEYVDLKAIPDNVVEIETRIISGKDDIINKVDEIKEKIINNRLEKQLKELSLLDQPFIRNTDITIAELVKQNIVLLGENIKIRRFKKFILGENLDL
uniref:Elongation factor Ts, mitochondrial n=1 Tax=Sporolithon durum TaxID=48970 RepID=A0A141SCT7_9FLOR|nr:elongation factor Ts [Sporolithon durum]AMK96105.1 elongation factor Ts [Sporolithon durum]